MPLIFLVWLFYLPNTPQFYIKNGQFDVRIYIQFRICFQLKIYLKLILMKTFLQKAEKALKYYKNCDEKNEQEKLFRNVELERLLAIDEERKKSSKLQLKDFCNRMALKGIISSIVMSWLYQMTGGSAFTNYASFIFEKSGTSLGIHVSSIILAVSQIVGGLVSTQLGDKFGRKTILIISLFFSAVGMFIFATYMYLRHNSYDLSNFLWIPVTSLSLVIFVSSAGIIALINICVIECFPPKVKYKI